jgi:hypothetical protein
MLNPFFYYNITSQKKKMSFCMQEELQGQREGEKMIRSRGRSQREGEITIRPWGRR